MASNGTERRYHLTEFADLFKALFKIADEGVQRRVLDAINGIVTDDGDGGTCDNCRRYRDRQFSDKGVQTTLISSVIVKPPSSNINPSKSIQTDSSEFVRNDSVSDMTTVSVSDSMTTTTTVIEIHADESLEALSPCDNRSNGDKIELLNMDSQESEKSAGTVRTTRIEIEPVPFRRCRKRSRKVPKVEKVDVSERNKIEGIVNANMNNTGTVKGFKRLNYSNEYEKFLKPKVPRKMSVKPEDLTQLFNCYSPGEINRTVDNLESSKNVLDQMKNEFEISLISENGLYPIHRAILDNEVMHLRRQIYVLKFMKIDINKLLTIDDESPIQLAVKNNSVLPIITELVNNKADVNELDKDSNTIIHLAMMYSDNTKLLRLLLDRIDYNHLNLFNDSGNTPLHIGVSEDRFYMCKTFLEFIDEKEKIGTCGNGINERKELLDIYKKELNLFPSKTILSLSQMKQKILNATNRRHGRTPLFLALTNRSEQAELMVLMLLVHIADPRVQDFTGMDSVSFALESFEVNRYNDALENSVIFFERRVLAREMAGK